MPQEQPEAEIRERGDRTEQGQAPRYDPPFLARLWLFVAVLVVIGGIAALAAWIF
jgi:hypothetical protein